MSRFIELNIEGSSAIKVLNLSLIEAVYDEGSITRVRMASGVFHTIKMPYSEVLSILKEFEGDF